MLESVIELLPAGVLVYGADRRVRLVNSAGRHIFGLDDEDALQGLSHRQLATRLAPRFANRDQACLALRPPSTLATTRQELTLVNPEQQLLVVRACARDREGHAIVRVILFQDVTASLADEQTRQERMMVVAHDLKTPLTNIKAYTQLAMMRLRQASAGSPDEGELDIVQQSFSYLQTVVEQADRLAQLIIELVECSRAGAIGLPGWGAKTANGGGGMAQPTTSRYSKRVAAARETLDHLGRGFT